ncbi:phytanoyl-CoA dioxygenase family protein [Komagataeibacter diospyri]|uniref:phytanoyl-CoA dioxygenase family protein n=1 Tax=Komagataeibacter diospyri TaxID=1932662 RepID=UPI003756A300
MTGMIQSEYVNASTRQDFDRDGVVCLRQVISPQWIARLTDALPAAIRVAGPNHFRFENSGEAGLFFGDVLVWQRVPVFEEFMRTGPLAAVSGSLMHSRTVTFYHDFLLIKEAGTSKRTPWHQDQSYWCVGGTQALTIWMPFDTVPLETSLEFVKGSHRWGQLFEAVPFDPTSKFRGDRDGRPPLPDIDATPGDYDILRWAMEPGDCLVFHCRTLHAAPGNPAPSRSRRVLSTCWAGDDAHYVEIKSDIAPPVRGDNLMPGQSLACPTFPRILPVSCPSSETV